jgi:hypothetical protein
MTYAPEADGAPDVGEVVWAWVAYEDDPSQGKDRPVLVLAREGDAYLCLMLSSKDHDLDAADEAAHGRHWMDIGTGGWDAQRRPSEVRLDRLLRLRGHEVRREGAALSREVYEEVFVSALRFHALPEPAIDTVRPPQVPSGFWRRIRARRSRVVEPRG